MVDTNSFKNKLSKLVYKLVYKLGLNYVEKIENDLLLLECLQ